MVVKHFACKHDKTLLFESRVILDGSQTSILAVIGFLSFESRVILDGSQTCSRHCTYPQLFESRVILDGSQTFSDIIWS